MELNDPGKPARPSDSEDADVSSDSLDPSPLTGEDRGQEVGQAGEAVREAVISPPSPRAGGRFRQAARGLAVGLLVVAVSGVVFLVTSGIVLFAAVLVSAGFDPSVLRDPARVRDALEQVTASRIGFLVMVVVPQLTLIAPAVGAAALSRAPILSRLGLVGGHWPWWAWGAAAISAPLVGMISGVVVDLFMDQSPQLEQMSEIFREHGRTGFLIPLALLIGLTPAVCEELLFRGFLQTGLTRSLGPVGGIGVASVLFAVFHFDPVHVISVFPIGLYLGWVSWRSGSLFPAMLAHFVNNFVSVLAVVFAPEGETDVLALPSAIFSLGILTAGALGLAAVAAASVWYGRPDPAGASPAGSLGSRAG